ncbi:MAG: peptide deformylase [Gammaproteobacteria bacterium SG8_15]|nr:MAG: peptide deformylase [Gammaproteobacteria bacterium SG8_15]
MAVRKVLRMGHPLLQESSADVTQFSTTELDSLIQDLFDTMHAEDGAGIAAPQVGVLKRVVIFGVEDENPRYPGRGAVPTTILINPVITPLDNEMEDGWEGCLSVPGMRGLVPRYQRVHYRGFDENGKLIERDADGFHARVVQHECDHLDGILYPQRIQDMSQFGFKEELLDKMGC